MDHVILRYSGENIVIYQSMGSLNDYRNNIRITKRLFLSPGLNRSLVSRGSSNLDYILASFILHPLNKTTQD